MTLRMSIKGDAWSVAMQAEQLIEQELERALAFATRKPCPPRLAAAYRYAVLPGGSRIRPRLTLAVALACGNAAPQAALAYASCLEIMHCASLIHDDLPCFDDALTRRGRPALHREFGEPLALLTGDGLIVLALQWLSLRGQDAGLRLPELMNQLASAVGAPSGIVAGQSWEEEPKVDLHAYHEAKTGALFSAATAGGALAAGADSDEWGRLGARLGEAYQVADDLRDALGDSDELGKPVGVDEALGRPNAVAQLGVPGAADRLRALVHEALASIPACPGRAALLETIEAQAKAILAGCKVRAAA